MTDAVQTTKATYALIAETFAGMQATGSPDIEADLDYIARQAGDGVVADIGCGPGRDTLALRDRGVRTVGLDLSDAMLRAGGLSGVAQADMRNLPVRGGSLSAVWCQAAFLHIPRLYAQPVLAEFTRILRPGGALHLAVAEGDSEGFEVAANYGSDAQRWFTFYREDTLVPLLTAAGFCVVGIRRWTYHREWMGVRAQKWDGAVR